MAELSLHGRDVRTVFDLLGDKEDDITYSLGWALSRSDRFLYAVLGRVFRRKPGAVRAVRLPEFLPGGGFTDMEVVTELPPSWRRSRADSRSCSRPLRSRQSRTTRR